MASESYKESQEVFVVKVSNEEIQEHLINSGYNIDIGTVSFKESDLQIQQYSTSKDTYVATSASSSDTDSNSSSESSGGVQNSNIEFVDDGKANIVTMLHPRLIVALPARENAESGKAKKDEHKEHEK